MFDTIPVSYSKASELLAKIKPQVSKFAKFDSDDRTNVLIIRDLPENIEAVKELVARLDTATPQVLIEARIVEVDTSFTRELGVQWGGNYTGNKGGTQYGIGGLMNETGGISTDGAINSTTTTPYSVTAPSPNYAVNLPASIGAGSGGGIAFGILRDNLRLDLALSALESSGKAKIVSSPKVVTVDNKEATIEQGTQIPYSTVSASGTNTQFIDATLSLKVTPHITPDGRVSMKLEARKTRRGETSARGQARHQQKKKATTEVLIGDRRHHRHRRDPPDLADREHVRPAGGSRRSRSWATCSGRGHETRRGTGSCLSHHAEDPEAEPIQAGPLIRSGRKRLIEGHPGGSSGCPFPFGGGENRSRDYRSAPQARRTPRALVAIVEGLPAGLEVRAEDVDRELSRRQSGHGRGGRMEIERDRVEILSGIRFGKTLGGPVAMMLRNLDWENWREKMAQDGGGAGIEPLDTGRPGHADLPGALKFGHADVRSVLERASARETAARVMAGALAKRLLRELGVEVAGHVISIGSFRVPPGVEGNPESALRAQSSPLRMADAAAEAEAIRWIDALKEAGTTAGGVVEVIATGLPPGLGSCTAWDMRLDGRLGQALMSIQAIKGVEIGGGRDLSSLPGNEALDELFRTLRPQLLMGGRALPFHRKTNRAGGLEGGMTNGEPLVARAAMKPIPTQQSPLRTVTLGGWKPAEAHRSGRTLARCPQRPSSPNRWCHRPGGCVPGKIRRGCVAGYPL